MYIDIIVGILYKNNISSDIKALEIFWKTVASSQENSIYL